MTRGAESALHPGTGRARRTARPACSAYGAPAGLLAVSLLLTTPVVLAGADAAHEALEAVVEPRLETMEPAVRDQLLEARAQLDRVLARYLEPAGSGEGPIETEASLAAGFGLLGQLYQAYDLFSSAAACYRNAARLDPADFRWPYYLGVLHQLDGRDPEALASFRQASELRPNHLPIMLRLAGLHLAAGRDREAEGLYRQVLVSNPASAAAEVGLGRIASARKDHAAAVARFERALELQPEADRTHYLLSMEYRRLGDPDSASEHLARTGSVGVGFFEPLLVEVQRLAVGAGAALGRGGDAQMLGLYDVALREYRRAVAEAPENADARFALGSLLVASGSVEEALEPLREAVRLDPERPRTRFLFGHVLFLQGRFAEAEPELRRALELSPGLEEARTTLAALLASTGRFEESVSLYRDVLAADPGDHEARLGLGKALVMLARADEGLVEFDAVLATADDSAILAQAHYNRAVVEVRRSLRDPVISRLGIALELDPALSDARYLLARVLAGAGREAEARTRLEQGLSVDPDSRSLALMLVGLLSCARDESARDGAAALELAERLYARERSLETTEALGMALAQAGRFERAAELQAGLVSEARRRDRAAWAEHLNRNLERYRAGEPCRIEAAN